MKNIFQLIFIATLLPTLSIAQLVAFSGIQTNVNAQDPVGFSFVALQNIPAGTEIYALGGESNCSFSVGYYDVTSHVFVDATRGILKYTTPDLHEGEVVVIIETSLNSFSVNCSDSPDCGTVSYIPGSGSFITSFNGQVALAYLYADSDDNPENGVTDIYSVINVAGCTSSLIDPTADFPNAVLISKFRNMGPFPNIVYFAEFDVAKRNPTIPAPMLQTVADIKANLVNWNVPASLSAVAFAAPPPPPPTISRTDADGDGNPDIFDPCSCGDPQNYVDGSGMVSRFHDFVTVTSVTGETWEVTAQTGAYSDDGVTSIPLGTVLTETPPASGVYRIDLYHTPGTGFTMTVDRTAGGPSYPLSTGGTCSPCAAIPALGQWGLILLSLLILTFGVVVLRKHESVLAMAGQGTSTSSNQRRLPFNKAVFGKMLVVVMVSLAGVFAVVIGFFGYEMNVADVPGSLVAGPLLAYLLHLLVKKD